MERVRVGVAPLGGTFEVAAEDVGVDDRLALEGDDLPSGGDTRAEAEVAGFLVAADIVLDLQMSRSPKQQKQQKQRLRNMQVQVRVLSDEAGTATECNGDDDT